MYGWADQAIRSVRAFIQGRGTGAQVHPGIDQSEQAEQRDGLRQQHSSSTYTSTSAHGDQPRTTPARAAPRACSSQTTPAGTRHCSQRRAAREGRRAGDDRQQRQPASEAAGRGTRCGNRPGCTAAPATSARSAAPPAREHDVGRDHPGISGATQAISRSSAHRHHRRHRPVEGRPASAVWRASLHQSARIVEQRIKAGDHQPAEAGRDRERRRERHRRTCSTAASPQTGSQKPAARRRAARMAEQQPAGARRPRRWPRRGSAPLTARARASPAPAPRRRAAAPAGSSDNEHRRDDDQHGRQPSCHHPRRDTCHE